MKTSIIFKSFLVILVCAMFAFTIMTPVYAATDEGFEDILGDGNTNTGNTNTGNTNTGNTNTGNTNTANTNTRNTNTGNVQNLNAVRNTSNTSNSLPNTGIGDSLPTVVLVVVFAISAVYAYKKVKDYRNID